LSHTIFHLGLASKSVDVFLEPLVEDLLVFWKDFDVFHEPLVEDLLVLWKDFDFSSSLL
jgi:hypothetical protein